MNELGHRVFLLLCLTQVHVTDAAGVIRTKHVQVETLGETDAYVFVRHKVSVVVD